MTPDEQEPDPLESKPSDSDDPAEEPEVQLESLLEDPLLEEQALVATKAKETQTRTMRAIISVHAPATGARVLSGSSSNCTRRAVATIAEKPAVSEVRTRECANPGRRRAGDRRRAVVGA